MVYIDPKQDQELPVAKTDPAPPPGKYVWGTEAFSTPEELVASVVKHLKWLIDQSDSLSVKGPNAEALVLNIRVELVPEDA